MHFILKTKRLTIIHICTYIARFLSIYILSFNKNNKQWYSKRYEHFICTYNTYTLTYSNNMLYRTFSCMCISCCITERVLANEDEKDLNNLSYWQILDTREHQVYHIWTAGEVDNKQICEENPTGHFIWGVESAVRWLNVCLLSLHSFPLLTFNIHFRSALNKCSFIFFILCSFRSFTHFTLTHTDCELFKLEESAKRVLSAGLS